MKTLHVDTGLEMRGGQWQALYLIQHLPDAVLLTPAKSDLFWQARARGVDTRPLSLKELAKLARKVDLVHTHDARAHTLAAVLGRAPLVVSRRVGFPVGRSMASRWKYGRAAGYLAVSKFAAARLVDAGVPAEKIRVIYDGVRLPPPARPQPGRVVALASKPVEVTGIPIHLSTDLWQDLSTASVFVYLSEMEGLGSAALAAMASAVPVVASRVGGLPEIVEHERTGLLIDDGEVDQALRRLLDKPAIAAAMGRFARERVRENFTVQKMVEQTLRAYEEILKC
jgi:hypothetical protein